MKRKFIVMVILLIGISVFASAENKYLKFTHETTISGKHFYKNEIYLVVNLNYPHDKYQILFCTDTINVPLDAAFILKNPTNDWGKFKLMLIKPINEKEFEISLDYFSSRDKAFLVSENENIFVKFNNISKYTMSKDSCGTFFRLLIPNSTTLFYYPEEITQTFKEYSKWNFWNNFKQIAYLCAACVVFFGILFSIWWFILRKRLRGSKEPKIAIFDMDSLDEFAEMYGISLKKLIKYNTIIPKEYINSTVNNRNTIKKNLRLKGTSLIIGYSSSFSNLFKKISNNPEEQASEIQKPKNTSREYIPHEQSDSNISQISLQSASDISQQLTLMKNEILGKIQSINKSFESSKEIDRLEGEVNTLKKENKNLDGKIKDLKTEKDEALKQLATSKDETNKANKAIELVKSELNQINERFIIVDFLVNYTRNVTEYLSLCNQVTSDAYEYYKKLNQTGKNEAVIIGQLLLKFELTKPSTTGNWEQKIFGIKESGAITDAKLIKNFKAISSNEEKLREFKRVMFQEFFEKYSSSILILAEEFRNMDKFTASSSELTVTLQNAFGKYTKEIIEKIKVTGFEIKYVPLFVNYLDYSGDTKLSSESLSLPYKQVASLKKDTVAEIVTYGFHSDLGNKSDTKIILA